MQWTEIWEFKGLQQWIAFSKTKFHVILFVYYKTQIRQIRCGILRILLTGWNNGDNKILSNHKFFVNTVFLKTRFTHKKMLWKSNQAEKFSEEIQKKRSDTTRVHTKTELVKTESWNSWEAGETTTPIPSLENEILWFVCGSYSAVSSSTPCGVNVYLQPIGWTYKGGSKPQKMAKQSLRKLMK